MSIFICTCKCNKLFCKTDLKVKRIYITARTSEKTQWQNNVNTCKWLYSGIHNFVISCFSMSRSFHTKNKLNYFGKFRKLGKICLSVIKVSLVSAKDEDVISSSTSPAVQCKQNLPSIDRDFSLFFEVCGICIFLFVDCVHALILNFVSYFFCIYIFLIVWYTV